MNATTEPTGTVLVDGLRIRYADSGGDGPVILLTSPWPESLLAFRRVWRALARTARLVSLDLPGFGHSEGRHHGRGARAGHRAEQPVHVLLDQVSVHRKPPQRGWIRPAAMDGSGLPQTLGRGRPARLSQT